MGAHRLDRTGWGRASLAALALLTACSGDGERAGGRAGGDGPDPAPTGLARREVARVNAEIDVLPEGVKVASPPPQCVQYEVTGGSYGKTRYQVDVVLQSGSGPAFTGPAGTKVFYRVVVDASAQRFDGWAGFAKPREVDGLALVPADDLSRTGTTTLQPDSFPGIQEVPPAMSRCLVTVRRADQEQVAVPGTRHVRDLDPVVQDVDANTRDIDDA